MATANQLTNQHYIDLYAQVAASPSDAQTLYSGANLWTATGGITRHYPVRAGRIRSARILFWVGGTLGTTETSTLYLRLNNTTDYQLTAAIVLNGRSYGELVTGLDIPIAITDYVELKWVNPTYTTNPTFVATRVLFELVS